jgi:predicted nucleic acid-binding protein
MRVLVDTNILLRSAQPNHPSYSQATTAVSRLMRRNDALYFCSQNVAEFWNVATRPSDRNGMGLSIEEALREIRSIEHLFTLLPDIPAVYTAWKRIVEDHRVQGVKVYDARLIAFMGVYAIEGILTFDVADFSRYKKATVLHPESA